MVSSGKGGNYLSKFILLYHDYETRGIIGEGRHFKFTLNGVSLGETALDFNCMSQQQVDILSVLVTNGVYIELAFNINGVFTTRVYQGTLTELVNKINALDGLLFMGNQNGKVGNDVCNQYLYAFKLGTLQKF